MSALPTPDASSSVAALYEQHYAFLVTLARRKYDLDEEEARPLVHDVFLNLLASRRPVDQAQAYLVVGVCRACSDYWRTKRRELPTAAEHFESIPTGVDEDAILRRMTLQAGLRQLRQRCRETLHLHFIQGCTAREVAARLHTTHRYAEKLISSCLQRLRRKYRRVAGM